MGLAWDPGLQGQMGTNDTERGWKPPSVMQMGLRPGDQILEMRVPLPQAILPFPSPPPRPCVSSQYPRPLLVAIFTGPQTDENGKLWMSRVCPW